MQTDQIEFGSDQLFRRNENIHIHMSNEHPSLADTPRVSDYIEMHYVISGEASYKIGDKSFDVRGGDLIFINKGKPFSFSELPESGEAYLYYSLSFNHSILTRQPGQSYPNQLLHGSFAFYTLNDTESNPYIFFEFSKNSHSMYGEFFNKMYMEYKKAQSGYNDAMMAYLTLIIINAIRLNESMGNSNERVYRKQAVEFVRDYINRCYCDANIHLAGLADRVYLNPDYLGRIFKKDTGMTVSEAIQSKRLERACLLLSTTDMPIAEIARKCGFCDANFFYKLFKHKMGTLPGQYRENTKH